MDGNDSTTWAIDFSPAAGFSKLLAVSIVVALTVPFVSCFGKRYAEEREETFEVPESYDEETPELEGESLDRWCSDFDAPNLEKLVDRTFEQNLDLRASWARLEQADAAARQAGAGRWPTLTAEASWSRTEQPSLPSQIDINRNQLKASLAASYEADLWGKMANRQRAARLDRRAVRAQVEAMAMSLTTQIAENWFNLVHLRAKRDLLERQVEISERFLELTSVRLGHGQASALDVNQQRQQIESLRGQLATIRGQIETAKHQIAVLVGESPDEETTGARQSLPNLPDRPDTGVPSDVLKRRPDVRAALHELRAADERTAVAVKDQFPSIRLSASLFYQAPNLDELFEQVFWQAMVAASQPLFDGGRRFNEVRRAEATAKTKLYEYASTVQTALREVRDAVILERRQREFIESLEQQQSSAQRVFDLARQRYTRGTTNYLRVLTALQSLQEVEQRLLDARRQQFSYRLQLCRALGGTWTRELEPPEDF